MYRPLGAKSREIRIVEILPISFAEQSQGVNPVVSVRLRYCSLNSPIAYEALSYTWGDPDQEALINVDSAGKVFVRRNLERALRDLRYQTEPRLVWVDALCINQADNDERQEQVKLMRDIYTAATVVRSWIDLNIDFSAAPFSRLHALSDNAVVNDLGEDPEFWDPIGEVLGNEYWCRIWVQQEIAYAAEWSIQCQSTTISSKCLMIFVTLVVLKQWGFFSDPLLDKTRWKALLPNSTRALLYRSRKDDGKVSSSTFYGPLHRALRDCRVFRSTDPKDKIFAMLGMIDGYRDDDMDVNYDFSDEQVYTNIVKLSIERCKSLDFLREVTLGNVAPSHRGLPSWVPDFSMPSTMDQLTSPSFSIAQLYPESNGLSSIPASITQGLLNVNGCQIGTVVSIAEAQKKCQWSANLCILDLIANLRYLNAFAVEIDVPVPKDCEHLDEYYSTYLFRAVTGADGRGTEHQRFHSYAGIFYDLLCAIPEDMNEEAAVTTFHEIINANRDHFGDIVHYLPESSRGRQLFVTDYSGLGLVPLQAALGDEIWCILGCPTPMTLRHADGRYLVVGEAYLNDCMQLRIVDGGLEILDHIPLPDYPVQELSLH